METVKEAVIVRGQGGGRDAREKRGDLQDRGTTPTVLRGGCAPFPTHGIDNTKSDPSSWKLDFGGRRHVCVGSSVVTNVPLRGGLSMMGDVVPRCGGQGGDGNSL